MALAQEKWNDEPQDAGYRPSDLVHLGNQTHGDPALEREVLALFAAQSRICMTQFRESPDPVARKRAIHSLKGTARSVGAFRLGDLSARLEQGDLSSMDETEAELDRVLTYISSLA